MNVPLQTHMSIVGIPLHPQFGPANDGWKTNQNELFEAMQNGLALMKIILNLKLLLIMFLLLLILSLIIILTLMLNPPL